MFSFRAHHVIALGVWPTLDDALAQRARRTASALGERLLEETARAPFVDAYGERFANRSLNGSVGYALAFLALATAGGDARFEAAMHAQLRTAATIGGRAAGLLDGVAGLYAVTSLAAHVEPRYAGFAARCAAQLDAYVVKADGSTRAYDLMFGAAGIRLARCIDGPRAADDVTRALEVMLGADGDGPCALLGAARGAAQHWLGIAHGSAGVLAALAITGASPTQQSAERLRVAAQRLCGDVRRDADGHIEWPRSREDAERAEPRAVWCVGASGIGSALLAVAAHCADDGLAAFARAVMLDVAQRPTATSGLHGVGICHGLLGNALALAAAAEQTADALLADGARRLTTEAIDELECRDGRCIARGDDGATFESLGFMHGLAGAITALLTLSGAFERRWLSLLGIGVAGAAR